MKAKPYAADTLIANTCLQTLQHSRQTLRLRRSAPEPPARESRNGKEKAPELAIGSQIDQIEP